MLIEDFNHILDSWISELQHYDLKQLCTQPAPHSWSLGQLYMHLIADTSYYMEQIKICIATNDNVKEEASPHAKTMFLHNAFPDEIIKGAPANSGIPQPDSKEQLVNCLENLKDEMNNMALLISTTSFKGKTKHPGLNYFSATEWLQFAEMHFRHHLKQKKRIDDSLKTPYPGS